MNTFTLKLLALILELYRLYITKTHLSILVIIPYLFYSTDIIMGCPIEILRIDRMMNEYCKEFPFLPSFQDRSHPYVFHQYVL